MVADFCAGAGGKTLGLSAMMKNTGRIYAFDISDKRKKKIIAKHFKAIMETLGLDLNDDSLMGTPSRVAKMYVDEIFAGLNYEEFPKISLIQNKMNTEEMVKVKAIKVISTCEHHFVTIDGLANVAYLPGKKIIGLSKINRIVSFFARRPQVQERLTQQVLVALQTLLETENVAVFMDATHYCVKARGIMDASSRTETSALGGLFKSDRNLCDNFLYNS